MQCWQCISTISLRSESTIWLCCKGSTPYKPDTVLCSRQQSVSWASKAESKLSISYPGNIRGAFWSGSSLDHAFNWTCLVSYLSAVSFINYLLSSVPSFAVQYLFPNIVRSQVLSVLYSWVGALAQIFSSLVRDIIVNARAGFKLKINHNHV